MYEIPTIPSRGEAAHNVFKTFHSTSHVRRYISGTVISTTAANANGNAFDVAKAYVAPKGVVPILMNHDWGMPVGLVTSLRTIGECLVFDGEICNLDRREWSPAHPWELVISQAMTALSFEPEKVYSASGKGKFTVVEVSIVDAGADAGAWVDYVWERDPVVRLNAPSVRTIWKSQRRLKDDAERERQRERRRVARDVALAKERALERERQRIAEMKRYQAPMPGEPREHLHTAEGHFVTRRTVE